MNEIIKGFKVFNPDWTCSPNRNTKQYTCPGKFEEDVTPVRCGQGMHFCKAAADCFNYYDFNPDNHVAEVQHTERLLKKAISAPLISWKSSVKFRGLNCLKW